MNRIREAAEPLPAPSAPPGPAVPRTATAAAVIEASGFPLITPTLVRFRLKGGRIIAKVSRSDVAAAFLAPPPERVVRRLLEAGEVTEAEVRSAAARPMADDLCVEADGGWLSSTADLPTLLPTVLRLRDEKAADTLMRRGGVKWRTLH
ncbi:hypothetical protein ABZ079_28070 [Streptomyces sp. NPDC006314]|uniref:hypothetical protein n=1 Tax=Streptomyces sp. NPDC006314 TaxID=3154475 RepID=UPI0033A13105